MGAQKDAGHVLVDMASSFDIDAGAAAQTAVMELAFQRMNEVDAVTATIDDDEQLHLNVTPLLGATMISLEWLVRQVVLARGCTRDEVVVAWRAYVDENFD